MCLTIIGLKVSEHYPFILIHNRDEFYARQSTAVHEWAAVTDERILAGKDLRSQGMWLGVTNRGRFGVITNYRDRKTFVPTAPSRGAIVRNFLTQGTSAPEYVSEITRSTTAHNPFNLVLGTFDQPLYYSSRTKQELLLTTGVYGLSNHLLDTPWHKIVLAKTLFSEIIEKDLASPEALAARLFYLLSDQTFADRDTLPDTGLDPELEYLLSPIFVQTPEYGTVSSTVILHNKNGGIHFYERRFDSAGALGEIYLAC